MNGDSGVARRSTCEGLPIQVPGTRYKDHNLSHSSRVRSQLGNSQPSYRRAFRRYIALSVNIENIFNYIPSFVCRMRIISCLTKKQHIVACLYVSSK